MQKKRIGKTKLSRKWKIAIIIASIFLVIIPLIVALGERLPIPGGDVGAWAQILNNFLRVSHNEDGTLKRGTNITERKSILYVYPPKYVPVTMGSTPGIIKVVEPTKLVFPNGEVKEINLLDTEDLYNPDGTPKSNWQTLLQQSNIYVRPSFPGNYETYQHCGELDLNQVFSEDYRSPTAGLQEALYIACKDNYDLHIYGGTGEAGTYDLGYCPGGCAQLAYFAYTTIYFPPMQGKKISGQGFSIHWEDWAIGNNPGIIIDSTMTVDYDFPAVNLNYKGTGDVLVFCGINPVPLDRMYGISVSNFRFHGIVPNHPNRGVLFDVQNCKSIGYNTFTFDEVGKNTPIEVTNAAPGNAFIGNYIKAMHVSGFINSAGLKIGTSSAVGGVTGNEWHLTFEDGTIGVDTWGNGDLFFISEASSVNTLIKLEPTAVGNKFFIGRSLATTLVDNQATDPNSNKIY